jgi:hypothetical protein
MFEKNFEEKEMKSWALSAYIDDDEQEIQKQQFVITLQVVECIHWEQN